MKNSLNAKYFWTILPFHFLPFFLVKVAQQYADSKLKGSFSTTQIHSAASIVSLLGHSDHQYVQLTLFQWGKQYVSCMFMAFLPVCFSASETLISSFFNQKFSVIVPSPGPSFRASSASSLTTDSSPVSGWPSSRGSGCRSRSGSGGACSMAAVRRGLIWFF